jgi:hypothetical protein
MGKTQAFRLRLSLQQERQKLHDDMVAQGIEGPLNTWGTECFLMSFSHWLVD